MPTNAIRRIDEDEKGALWFYHDQGLSKWQNERLTRVAPAPGSPFNDYLRPLNSTFSATDSANPTPQVNEEIKKNYALNCAARHASDGGGDTAIGRQLKASDLRSEKVQKQSDQGLYEVIAKGKKKMPGFEKKLGKDQSDHRQERADDFSQ